MIDTETLASRWGFIANPFREPVAEREQNREKFFVQPPYFTEILGDLKKPSSTFVFGHRGDGKSTLRLAVQNALQVAARRYLVVDYTAFSGINADDARNATLKTHLEAIFSAVVDRLLKEAASDSTLVASYTADELNSLRWFALRFAPKGDWRAAERRLIEVLSKGGKDRDLKRLGLRGSRHVVSYLRQKRQEMEKKASTGERGLISDVASLVLTLIAPEIPGAAAFAAKDAESLLAELLGIVRRTFLGIVVLVDRVDEAPSFGSRPAIASDFIRPLATALTILEADGFAVKFFLPWEIYDLLKHDIRSDRLTTRTIEWQDSALRELLRRRLLAFSVERVSSLDDRIDPTIKDSFYQAIFHYSAENPRNMLRLLDSILTELADMEESPELITQRAARLGIDKFVAVRSNESDGDAYVARLRKRGTPPAWTVSV